MIQENHPAMTMTDDRTYLAVPYDEKDNAKQPPANGIARRRRGTCRPARIWKTFTPWLPAEGSTVHIAVDMSPAEHCTEDAA